MINILLLFLGSTCKFLKENSPNICHKSCKTCFGSQIDEKNMISNWINPFTKIKYKLLFRASQDDD